MEALQTSLRLLTEHCSHGPLLLLSVPVPGRLGELPEEIAEILTFLPPGAGLCYDVTRGLPEADIRGRIGHVTCKVAHEAEEAALSTELESHLGGWYDGLVTVESIFGH
jgi:hypothetical protein